MTPDERSALACRMALDVGFDRVGVASAGPVAHGDDFDDWLARGCAGEMTYLARHRSLRRAPGELLPGARSVIVVAHNHYHGSWAASDEAGVADDEARGRIAQYAWGRDYHIVVRDKLQRLVDRLRTEMDESFETRVCVDTAPIMEREVAAAAGLGWIGKNTMVLHRELGSYFFLGEIITTLELAASALVPDGCGSCTRCLEACPTGALIAPHQMDARRCIAYLTIEHRGDVPADLQPRMGDWIFGCDVCQEVCPYNRHAPLTAEAAYGLDLRHPLPPRPLLAALMTLSEDRYERFVSGSAVERATLEMMRRNAEIARQNGKAKDAHARRGG